MVYQAAIPRATHEIIGLYRRGNEQIGHMSPGKLIDAVKLEVIDGIPKELTPGLIQQIARTGQCSTYACFWRQHENITKGSGSYPPAESGARMSMDELGPKVYIRATHELREKK